RRAKARPPLLPRQTSPEPTAFELALDVGPADARARLDRAPLGAQRAEGAQDVELCAHEAAETPAAGEVGGGEGVVEQVGRERGPEQARGHVLEVDVLDVA